MTLCTVNTKEVSLKFEYKCAPIKHDFKNADYNSYTDFYDKISGQKRKKESSRYQSEKKNSVKEEQRELKTIVHLQN